MAKKPTTTTPAKKKTTTASKKATPSTSKKATPPKTKKAASSVRKTTPPTRKKATPPARKKTPSTTARGAKQGKGMAVIAYFGILCLIPLISGASRKSPFMRFHANQGLVLFITTVVWMIVWAFIWTILMVVILYDYTWGFWRIMYYGSWGLWLAIALLCVIGIINAARGKMKRLPVIGKIKILK